MIKKKPRTHPDTVAKYLELIPKLNEEAARRFVLALIVDDWRPLVSSRLSDKELQAFARARSEKDLTTWALTFYNYWRSVQPRIEMVPTFSELLRSAEIAGSGSVVTAAPTSVHETLPAEESPRHLSRETPGSFLICILYARDWESELGDYEELYQKLRERLSEKKAKAVYWRLLLKGILPLARRQVRRLLKASGLVAFWEFLQRLISS